MNNIFMKIQSVIVYAVLEISIALFVLYLGFMTHYYVLFYDGTYEMFEYYKQLQVFNKESFSLVIHFVVLAFLLLVFAVHKVRPGIFGLAVVLGVTVYVSLKSFLLINVLAKYKRMYLSLDFSSMEEYIPSTFVFDAGLVLHYMLIGSLIILSIISLATFIQRIKEGNPLVRKVS